MDIKAEAEPGTWCPCALTEVKKLGGLLGAGVAVRRNGALHAGSQMLGQRCLLPSKTASGPLHPACNALLSCGTRMLSGFCACDRITATVGQQLWGLGSQRSSFQDIFLRLCLIFQFLLAVPVGLILPGAQGPLTS